MISKEWTTSDKIQIVIEGLKGASEESLLEKYGVSAQQYRSWIEQFLDYAHKGFDGECGEEALAAYCPDPAGNFFDLVKSIPHAVFCKDLNGRFLYGNPAFCAALKVDPDELAGKDDFDIHTPEAAEKYRADDQKVVVSGKGFSCQEEHVHVDGSTLWAEVVKAPLKDDADNITGVMGMFWDITQQKLTEKALRDSSENLEYRVEKRTVELLEANKRLEEAAKLKNDFLSSVSHELRTPLTSILGFAMLIDRDIAKIRDTAECDSELEARLIKRIADNADIINVEGLRLKRLIDDLLDLEKIGSGKMSWVDDRLDLNDVVRASVETMRGQFAAKPMVELRFEPSSFPVHVLADFDRIKQVLINLLNNAAKFTNNGSVTVTTRTRGNRWAEVRVVDTGQGISREELAHIFEDYYQGMQPVIHEKGTGLGLPICHEIINHYGGKFWAESPDSSGSTFYVLLPLLSDDA